MTQTRAFTLIELLIAMAILAMLGGMLMTMLNVAQRQGRITNTKAVLAKVDQAIRLFRTDMRVYPWQTDLSGAEGDPTQLTNNLAFRLAWRPADDAERLAYTRAFHADLRTIQGKFTYFTGDKIGLPGGDGTHAFRTPNVAYKPYVTNILMEPGSLRVGTPAQDGTTKGFIATRLDGYITTRGIVLSRLAEEITRLRYVSGQLDVTATGDSLTLPAPQGVDPAVPADKVRHPEEDGRYQSWWYQPDFPNTWINGYSYVPYNRAGAGGDDSRGPVLDGSSVPDPVGNPGGRPVQGWRSEYLSESFRRRTGPGSPGEIDATGTRILDVWGNPLVYVCAVVPGARGYTHACDNGGGGISEQRYGLGPQGRTETDLLASDIRGTAAKSQVMEFELWSPGPDGRVAVMRDDPVNRDNIAIIGYNRGLR
jgi:prepilin-type N-terminal cleavage/methylation domain-containing protein